MSDSDDPGMCRVFAVNSKDTGEDFDLDIPPTSGLEYLRRVQVEAKHCPAIVVADIDASIFIQKQTVDTRVQCAGLHPAPLGFAPTLQWQREQTANFSDVRQSLVRYKARTSKEERQKEQKLPTKEDVDGWCRLCFGRVSVRNRGPSNSSESGTVESSKNGMTTTPQTTDQSLSTGGTPPLLSIVAQMDQPTVLRVIEYHNNWFEATGFSKEQGQWFFALMACLEKPLVPEACSLLRELARNCANLRATLESTDDPKLSPLNLLICLVARYFDQTDLAEDG